MFTGVKLEKYANVLLWALKSARKGTYKKNDIVLIRYDLAGIKLAEILQGKLLDMGLHPLLRAGSTPDMERNFFDKSNSKQLVFQAPGDRELYSAIHGAIYLHAPESLTHLKGIDPKRIGKAALARKSLRDILDKREDEGNFGWTLCMIPTDELAKQAGLTLKQYGAQVIKACYLDKRDPVQAWKNIFSKAVAIKNGWAAWPCPIFTLNRKTWISG